MEKKGKIAAIGAAITTVATARRTYSELKEWYDSKSYHIASITTDSYVAPKLLQWLNMETETNRVKVVSKSNGIHTIYDGAGTAEIELEGYRIFVSIEKPIDRAGIVDYDDVAALKAETIIFKCRKAEGIEALKRKLISLTDEFKSENKDIYIYTPESYGWSGRRASNRNLDSIFLPNGDKERITNDLDTFLANEDRYHRMGAPWHRGYLLYGEPGNGKSSLAAALAWKYRLNVYSMPLSTIKDDHQLAKNVSQIDSNSLLLIEDVDIFSRSMSREQSDSDGPTLAGLFNALDGVATPNGLITFMTTNKIDVLDPTLIRPGRVDLRLEFKSPVDSQVESLFEYVYDEPLGVQPRSFSSMAEVVDTMKINTTDPEGARLLLKEDS